MEAVAASPLNGPLTWPEAPSRGSGWRSGWRRFSRHRPALVSVAVLAVLLVLAILAPQVARHYPNTQHYSHLNSWPTTSHWLGTDDLGRDVFARLLYGLRVSFAVVFLAETLTGLLGVTVGILAGYYGRWLDGLLSRVTDVLFAFPGILLVVLVMSLFGPTFDVLLGGFGRLLLVFITLSLVGWPGLMRVVRSQVLSLKQQQFIEAAHSIGASPGRILLRHILPNVISLPIVWLTTDTRRVIISEATISLLGLGVQPPNASLGTMITSAVNYLDTNWTEVLWPSLAVSVLVLCFGFFGDGLRDALDTRMRLMEDRG
ncbi:MAG: ABC transporter permease [Chloroflexota bacterium]